MCMKNENEKMQELLANSTSEQLLREVHNRNNIYINGRWNSDHILDITGLPKEYHEAFIAYISCDILFDKTISQKYSNKSPIDDRDEIKESVLYWLDNIKADLHNYLVSEWFFDVMAFGGCEEINSDSPEKYRDFINQRLEICYEPVDGIYPFIDLSYKKGDGDEEEIQNIILDLITVFKPHQGNLKTYLEEKMQELINDYLGLNN